MLWYLMDEDESERGSDRAFRRGEPTPPAAPPTPTELRLRFRRLEERLRNMEACVTSDEFELRRELRKLEG